MPKPRVVVISHTYTVEANRGKFNRLSDFAEITLIVPLQWKDTLGDRALDPVAVGAPYRLTGVPICFSGRLARHAYSPLALVRALHTARPQLVHIEEEPIGLAFLQTAALKSLLRYRLSFFTWQNIWLRTRVIERLNLAAADAAIAGNVAAAAVLREKGFHRPVSVAPQLGVPFADAIPDHPCNSTFNIGYVGRLVIEKGLLVLFDALDALTGDWHCHFIGGGPLETELRQRAQTLGLSSRVTFHGAVSHAAVANKLSALDILVLPSLTTHNWKEQFGHVLIEAMTLGVPVVGSNSGAIPEVVADAGIIVPEGDANALAVVLSQLSSNAELRHDLSRRGRMRAQREYTDEGVAEKTWRSWQATLAA